MPTEILIVFVEWMGIVAITMIAGISPAFQRRPLIFKYPRREGLVALSLAALLIVVTAAIFLIFFSASAAAPAAEVTPPLEPAEPAAFIYGFTQLARQLGISLFIALPFVVALRVRKQPGLSAGFNRQTQKPSIQLGFALGLATIFLTGKTYAILNGVTIDEGYYFVAMLAVGLVEEFIFRGYIQVRWMAWLGETRGWIATSVLYSLWHIPQKLLVERASLEDLALSLGLLFVSGLIYGWIMRKSGNVLAPGIYHAIHNWAQIL